MKKAIDPHSNVTRKQFILKTGISLAGITAAGYAFGMSSVFRYKSSRLQIQEFQQSELPTHIFENNLADDPLLKLGFLNLKLYATGDGVTDDTAKFQQALNDAYNSMLALYVPPGTYLVSDTLDCAVNRNTGGGYADGKGYPIIGDPDNRPVIKLINNAPLFQNPSSPKPVLKIYCIEGTNTDYGAWLMNCGGVSSIIIDCGEGNPGAIGFKCHGAQAQFVENLTVRAYGAYAGIKDVVGNAGFMVNIEVLGGKYGIWAQYGQSGAVAGCRLIDQETAAIRQELWWPITLAGFAIEKETGPVVEINDGFGKFFNSHITLTDGTVTLAQKSPAFVNLDNRKGGLGRSMYIKNVYVKNADTLISSYGRTAIPALNGEWTHIIEYSYACKDAIIRVNGVNQTTEIINLEIATPPKKLIDRHKLTRREIPFGLDTDAVCITDPVKMGSKVAVGDGIADDTEALRYAVDQFSKVFVPKGVFRISKTIPLKKNTVLFGIAPSISELFFEVSAWGDLLSLPGITSPDDASANCILSQLRLTANAKSTGWNGGYPLIEWKSGRYSMVKNVYPKSESWTFKVPDAPLIRISGNGGGRWYAFEGGSSIMEKVRSKMNYFHFHVKGTHEPLVIYSHCSIYGDMPAYNLIEDSVNIELHGGMDEPHGPTGKAITYFKIRNSSNILINSHSGHLDLEITNGIAVPNYYLENCNNITMGVITSHYGVSSGAYWYRLKDNQGLLENKTIAYYRLGNGFRTPCKGWYNDLDCVDDTSIPDNPHHEKKRLSWAGDGNLLVNIDDPGNYTISMYSLNGKPVWSDKKQFGSGLNSIHLQPAVPPGIYLGVLSGFGNRFVSKIIVMN